MQLRQWNRKRREIAWLPEAGGSLLADRPRQGNLLRRLFNPLGPHLFRSSLDSFKVGQPAEQRKPKVRCFPRPLDSRQSDTEGSTASSTSFTARPGRAVRLETARPTTCPVRFVDETRLPTHSPTKLKCRCIKRFDKKFYASNFV